MAVLGEVAKFSKYSNNKLYLHPEPADSGVFMISIILIDSNPQPLSTTYSIELKVLNSTSNDNN